MPDALGALHRIDFVIFNALINGLVWTLRLADIAINALIGDLECQNATPFLQTGGAWPAGLLHSQTRTRHRPALRSLSPAKMK